MREILQDNLIRLIYHKYRRPTANTGELEFMALDVMGKLSYIDHL